MNPLRQTKFCFPLIILSVEDNYRGSWPTQVAPIYEDTIIHAQYEEATPVPTLPTDPGEIMSGGEGEPIEADENVAGSCLAAGVAFSATYVAASISAGTGDDHTAGIMSDMTFGFSGALVSSSGTAIAEKVFAEKKDAAPQLPHVRQGANRRIVNPAMLM